MPNTSSRPINFNRIKCEVTQEDIERGHRSFSGKCMASRAIARTIPMANRIDTDFQTCRFTVQDERFVYLVPPALMDYISDYDGGREIKPFKFVLKEPMVHKRQIRSASREISQGAKAKSKIKSEGKFEAVGKIKAKRKSKIENGVETSFTYKDENGRNPPPSAFRRKQRSYGQRRLVMNQLSEEEKDALAVKHAKENYEKEKDTRNAKDRARRRRK